MIIFLTAFVCFKSLIAKGFLDRLRQEGSGQGEGCLKKKNSQNSSLSLLPPPISLSPFRFKYFGAGRNVGELEPLPLLTVFFYFAAKESICPDQSVRRCRRIRRCGCVGPHVAKRLSLGKNNQQSIPPFKKS